MFTQGYLFKDKRQPSVPTVCPFDQKPFGRSRGEPHGGFCIGKCCASDTQKDAKTYLPINVDKPLHNYGKSPCLMGKSTMNVYVQ